MSKPSWPFGMPSDVEMRPEDVAIVAAHVIEAWTEGAVSAVMAADIIFEILEGEPTLDFLLLAEAVMKVQNAAIGEDDQPANGVWN
jgi:hypothetical protein